MKIQIELGYNEKIIIIHPNGKKYKLYGLTNGKFDFIKVI
jgi:hypothetical protein